MMSNGIDKAMQYIVGATFDYQERIEKSFNRNNKAIATAIANMTEADIRARDRVDISLEEYETMKKRIERLESENRMYVELLERIKFPHDVLEKIDNIKVMYSGDFHNMLDLTSRRRCRIEFDIVKER